MKENEISAMIVNKAYEIHVKLGLGLLEAIYEEILCYELRKIGLSVVRQKSIPVKWDGLKMDIGFKADLIVEDIDRKSVV